LLCTEIRTVVGSAVSKGVLFDASVSNGKSYSCEILSLEIDEGPVIMGGTGLSATPTAPGNPFTSLSELLG
jgi:hypothetical protein